MANSSPKKKKSSTSRSTSRSSSGGSRAKAKSKAKKQPLSPRQREIVGVAVLALALLLMCCIILAPEEGAETGALGTISLLLLELMRFLAGAAAITMPLALLFYGSMMLIGRDKPQARLRFTGLLTMWAAFLGMFSLGQPLIKFGEYMFNSAAGAGGGFIGGLLAFMLKTAFGATGSLIILVALAIIGLLLFTDRSLAEMLRALGSRLAALFESLRETEPRPAREEKAPPREESAPRRVPLIISHDDPAPLISAPVEAEPAAPPAGNRFSAEFLPDVDAAQAARIAKAAESAEPAEPAEPAEKEVKPRKIRLVKSPESSAPPAPATAEEKKTPPLVVIDGQPSPPQVAEYRLPPVELVEAGVKVKNPRLNKAITESIGLLETTLGNFGVKATVTQVVAGPAVTRYELQPAPGVKVARIVSLADDIALALAATAVRIEAPIPGKSAIGIEVARSQVDTVYFREVMETPEFLESNSKISFALGKNIGGEPIIGDLAKMPHLLIAGATGSGKSICVNSIICSILYKAKPSEVKLMLIDPKKVEMAHYNVLPHLVAPVVTDSKKAANALKWVVNEMENRYSLFVGAGVKDFAAYNVARPEEPLPQIVVVIDELADLMMVAKHDVEDAICRIAQMARAAGIHLLVATQRPSVDVITGLIKANIPSRIAFAVSSYTDSRTILDMGGAEKLLGRGDMLYAPIGANKPMRVQGSFMTEQDIAKLVDYCAEQAAPRFVEAAVEAASASGSPERLDDVDELFHEAAAIIISSGQASTSFLQRRLSIGNPRAARLIDMLESKGVVGGPKGAKPRDILMSLEEFHDTYGDAG